jgi:hypothetical protein
MTDQAQAAKPANTPKPAAAVSAQVPAKNRLVLYRVNAAQIAAIKGRREHARLLYGDTHQGHNDVQEGDEFPMLIVRVWGDKPDSAVNGQVFLDAAETLWVTSVKCGEGPGTWSWPPRG